MNRVEEIPPEFSPTKQIARTATLAIVLLSASFLVARHAPVVAWTLVPAFWIFANVFEWTVHRFPMHRPMFPRLMYRNHALIHHGAFADTNMAMTGSRELYLIMMPWYTIVMLLIAASPVAIVAGLIGGLPFAGIFYVAALSYFVCYETLHALYHVAPERLARLGVGGAGGWFFRLRAHHVHHHTPRRMAHVNFNVTVPLADVLFGTRERAVTGASSEPAPGRAAAT